MAGVGLTGGRAVGTSPSALLAAVTTADGTCHAYTVSDTPYEPFPFGAATYHVNNDAYLITTYADRVVGMAADPATGGYWLVGADGGVFVTFTAPFYGSLPGIGVVPNQPIVGIAANPTGGGYWLVTADGGVFSFGTAPYEGSVPGDGISVGDIVGVATPPGGGGYWLVARDGGIFSFGDAGFDGSMGGVPLSAPVVGMAVDPATGGYWLVGSDGGVFAFTAPFYGSMVAYGSLTNPIESIGSTAGGNGYWLLPTLPPPVPGVPVLGEPVGSDSLGTSGFGHIEPCEVNFNGDALSLTNDIEWTSWGGPEAIGTGMTTYVPPGELLVTGTIEQATVVAFDPGECHGVFMYEKYERYFPQHGESFDPDGNYWPLCTTSVSPTG